MRTPSYRSNSLHGVRGWTSERERVDPREEVEREARGKGRKSSVPFPELDSSASAAEAAGSGNFPRRVPSADVLDAMQNLAVTGEPAAFQSRTLTQEEHDRVDDDDLPRRVSYSAALLWTGELSRTHTAPRVASYLPPVPPTHLTRSGRIIECFYRLVNCSASLTTSASDSREIHADTSTTARSTIQSLWRRRALCIRGRRVVRGKGPQRLDFSAHGQPASKGRVSYPRFEKCLKICPSGSRGVRASPRPRQTYRR